MASPKASTPRPHETTGAGWGGMRRAMTVATAKRRKTPRHKGQMCYRTNLLHGNSHDAPPVVISSRPHHSGMQSAAIGGLSSQAKIGWFNLIP